MNHFILKWIKELEWFGMDESCMMLSCCVIGMNGWNLSSIVEWLNPRRE